MFGQLQRPTVLVLGLGESGLAMAHWCVRHGCRVRVADTREAPARLAQLQVSGDAVEFVGGAFEAALLAGGIDLVAISPGLSPLAEATAEVLKAAAEQQIPVWGELEFFAQALAALRENGYQPQVLAITGTNGKTTTTALTGELCARAGKSVAVAGNISPSMLDKLTEAIDAASLPQIWVLELSSFQLETAHSFAPDAAALLNLSQDHLDWHGSMDAYGMSKRRIFGPATVRVLNRDDAYSIASTASPSGATITFGLDQPGRSGDFGLQRDGGIVWLATALDLNETRERPALGERGNQTGLRRRAESAPVELAIRHLMPVDALRIRGLHNAANAMAALALTRAIELPLAPLLHGLREYRGEPHRVELIASINQVDFVDDSKGTNVGATVAALDGLAKRTVLIAGGEGKGQDFTPLGAPVMRWCRAVILIGRDAPVLRAALASSGVPLIEAETLEAATREANSLAQANEVVLLSPACASFDMFSNYAHRADVFRRCVQEIAADVGVLI
jgi:UDP-N-acetylmuramoylalanine--D-glutamate ligase